MVLKKERLRQIMAFFLILALILPAGSPPSFAAGSYEDYLDGWKVDCVWSDSSYDCKLYFESDVIRRPKLIFSYRLENAERDYEPGSLSVEIPGIGNACRKGIEKASFLPTDSEDTEWNVSWDQERDVYTFTNSFDVKEGQSLNGGFEVIWELKSRDTEHGYAQERSPKFSVSGRGSITLRPLGFSCTSKRDRYRIELNRSSLNSRMSEKADSDHIWYGFTTVFDKDWLSRGLRCSSCSIEIDIPEGPEPEDVVVRGENGILIPLTEETGGTLLYELFEKKTGDLGNENKTFSKDFMVGFPRGSLGGEEVTVRVHLDRLYNDEEEWVREAGENERVDCELTLSVDEYDLSYNGLLYRTDLWNEMYENFYRQPDYYWYGYEDELTHLEPVNYGDRLNATDLYNGKVVEFMIRGSAKKDYGPAKTALLYATPSDSVDTGEESLYAVPAAGPDIVADEADLSLASASDLKWYEGEGSAETGASQINEEITGSIIGEKDEYSMVLGDDVFAVFLQDGSMRSLEDEEYDFAYLKMPVYEKNYGYDIYAAPETDTPFEDYQLLGSADMSEGRTFSLPDGVKTLFVRINGITGNLDISMAVGVRFHLDWQEEQEKERSDRIDHENRLVNFSFLRALCLDAQNKEHNDCVVPESGYGGTYGEELAGHDEEIYGESLLRDYSNVWLRGTVTSLRAGITIDPFEPGEEAFSSEVRVSGTIRSDDEGELSRFSLYTVLPDGLKADFGSGPFTVSGKLTYKNGEPVDYPEDHVSFSEGSYNGRKMIIADFDFSHVPLMAEASNRVYISYPVTLSRIDQAMYGDSYSVNAYLMIHDEGIDRITGSAITGDEYDIDGNGNTAEKMAYAGAFATIEKNADEWREFVSKYVKSAYSEGYGTDAVTSPDDPLYEYRLDFGLGSSAASDIVFYDHLDQGAVIAEPGAEGSCERVASEWQGEFCSVDTSYAKSIGLEPTVYYSVNEDEAFDLSSPGWSTECPDDRSSVRSIAVALDTQPLPDGLMHSAGMIYIIVKMRAPESERLTGRKAVNQYSVSYDSYGASGGYEGRNTLPSGAACITLLDSVGKIILEKVDADNVIRVDADGKPHHATLTGGTFQIYDENGKALFGTPQSLNPFGRIVVDNIPAGTYYWEEKTAPEGYELIPGRHAFTADGYGEVLTVENHRLSGSVTLRKHDQDDADLKLLSGAVYELTMGNGQRVFTDADYSYAPDGEVSYFMTGSDGTFTITGLPWGNYEFTETRAPEGYELSQSPLSFTVGKDSYDSGTDTITVQVDAYDTQGTASIRLVKSDSESMEPVSGAVYSLFRCGEDGDECIASGLKTGMDGETEVDGLKFGTYYFAETLNPGGYLLPYPDDRKTITVTLGPDTVGEVVEVSHQDDRMRGSVRLRKSDDTGRLVPGAAFDLCKTSESGDEIYIGSFVTASDKDGEDYGEIYVDDLEWGDYSFKETEAPPGYEPLKDTVPFTVDRVTVQNTIELDVVNEKMRGSVKLVKADRSDSGKLLPGAEFELFFASGEPCAAGIDYHLPEGSDSIITGDDGSVTITGLKQGAYYFREIKAPDSYSLSAEVIRFSVTMENAGLIQELLVEDDRGLAVITIDKEVNDVCEAFGNPSFIFKITRSDGVFYFAVITLSPASLSGSVSLNVEQGYTYRIEEVAVSRYEPDRAETVKNAEVAEGENAAVADLLTNDEAEVKFYNVMEQYEKFSHTATVVNSLKKSARLTGVTVIYNGPDPITADLPGFDAAEELYRIPYEDLEVYAFYDDGTSEKVSSENYILSPLYADGNSDSYTGTVSVFRDGVQRSASFSVNLSLPVPEPRSLVTYELNGGSIVPPGESSAVDIYTVRVKTGSTLTSPVNDPVRENFRFTGWFLDEKLQTPAEFPLTVTKDMSIYAGWEQEPVNIRYAVSLYGINADTDGQGKTAGLTFGPALGASWLNTSRSHVPSEGQRCLHSMSWNEIIEQSRTDPEVFEECLKNGCTHSVELTIRGVLAEDVVQPPQAEGDGASVLFDSINGAYLKWDASPDGDRSYAASDINKVLNGGAEGVSYSLADALPPELQIAIQKKKTVNEDMIWLFSMSELFPENELPADIRQSTSDGKLYERQKLWGADAKYLTGCSENGRAEGFWLRTESSPENVFMVSDDGSYREESKIGTGGIAFGFCLPGPEPSTRVALSLFGIKHDQIMEENGEQALAGLTFGPALGGDYTESYVSHDPAGATSAGNRHRCIHFDDWDTIASWSLKDPWVYEQCMGDTDTPSCTKGLDIFLNDSLAGKKYSFTGDGSGVMYKAISDKKRSFSYPYSLDEMAPNDGGWPASYIRAVLNGADEYTNKLCDGSSAVTLAGGKPVAGENPPGKEESLFSCLPSGLRSHIVPRAVVSDTWNEDVNTTEHTMVTYDRLWLFSADEIWATEEGYRPNEGEAYEKQVRRGINNSAVGNPDTIAYGENGTSSLSLRTIGKNSRHIIMGIGPKGEMNTVDVTKNSAGIGFGFCLR